MTFDRSAKIVDPLIEADSSFELTDYGFFGWDFFTHFIDFKHLHLSGYRLLFTGRGMLNVPIKRFVPRQLYFISKF